MKTCGEKRSKKNFHGKKKEEILVKGILNTHFLMHTLQFSIIWIIDRMVKFVYAFFLVLLTTTR